MSIFGMSYGLMTDLGLRLGVFAEHFPSYVPTAHYVSRYRSSAATTSPLGDSTSQSDTA